MRNLHGRIVKGLGGFYYVDTGADGIYECRGRGIFRKDNTKLLIGDIVDLEVTHDKDMEGSITKLYPRKCCLRRPEVSNVDQAIVVFAIHEPEPNHVLLDRFLITMKKLDIETILVWNKADLAAEAELDEEKKAYRDAVSSVNVISAKGNSGMDELKALLEGKISLIAGPSGVGKSTMLNALCPGANAGTGEISRKMKRGKHTTRHAELFGLGNDTYLLDTPGFTALDLEDMDQEEVKAYYPEFYPYEGKCRFNPCSHTHEPSCAVREAAECGDIPVIRYDNYKQIYTKQKEIRRY